MDGRRWHGIGRLLGTVDHRRVSRRSALGRLGRGGVAATLLAGTGGASSARGQDAGTGEADALSRSGTDGDAGEAPRSPEDLVVPPASRADLAAADEGPAGRLRRLTDDDRGLWLDGGDGWFGLAGGVYDVRAYGATGDGQTDDAGAFRAAIEAMTSALDPDANSPFGRTLRVPPGTYRLSRTLILDRAIRLVGTGGGGPFGESILQPDPGIVGVLVEAARPPFSGVPGRRGDGSIIERLRIEPGAAGAAANGDRVVDPPTEGVAETPDAIEEAPGGSAHGIWLRAPATIRGCRIAGFDGDGIRIEADRGAPDGAVAGWGVDGGEVSGCAGHGLHARGSGASGGVCSGLAAIANGGRGLFDEGTRGNTYLGCRSEGNEVGAFATTGQDNRGIVVGCVSGAEQPRAAFAERTIVVGGHHAAGFEGGNAWTAIESRVSLRAQPPGGSDAPMPTAPTLRLVGSPGQTEPHLRIEDRGNERQAEVDAAGRLLVGPADLLAAAGPDAPGFTPVRVQISDGRSGQAAIRWVLTGETGAAWVAAARAYRDAVAVEVDAPIGAGLRLTFQTPDAVGGERDTLTLRDGRIGVGTVAPDSTAALEVASASQGFLPPRLTTEQRDAIPAPAEGLVLYNRTTRRLNLFDGDAWRELGEAAVGG